MNKIKLAVLTLLAMTSLSSMSATRRDLSLAIEDAARATVDSLAADARVKDVKSIAFVKLNLPDGMGALTPDSNDIQVFEATLASKAVSFTLVTHDTHADEWTLIDGIFNQAADFESYDTKTHPELKKLKLADALLFGQVVDAAQDVKKDGTTTSVRIAMRLLKVSTGEQMWGSVVNGRHVQTVEARDIKKEIVDDAKSMFTFKNILIGIGGLVVLLIVLLLIGKMVRVR